MALTQEPVSQVRTEESGGAGYEYAHGQDLVLLGAGH
jgi:hypothetical protein